MHNLTNEEIIRLLSNRADLTPIECELLDRLIRAIDALRELEVAGGVNT